MKRYLFKFLYMIDYNLNLVLYNHSSTSLILVLIQNQIYQSQINFPTKLSKVYSFIL